jgi:RHS repeat-associated protein
MLSRSDTDPYGLQRRESYPLGVDPEGHGYTGQEKEADLGLYYYGARYYFPEVGRFLQNDPWREHYNPYDYAHNNPVFNVDPTGKGIKRWFYNLTHEEKLTKEEWEARKDALNQEPYEGQVDESATTYAKDPFWADLRDNYSNRKIDTDYGSMTPRDIHENWQGIRGGTYPVKDRRKPFVYTQDYVLTRKDADEYNLINGARGVLMSTIAGMALVRLHPYIGVVTGVSIGVFNNTYLYIAYPGDRHFAVVYYEPVPYNESEFFGYRPKAGSVRVWRADGTELNIVSFPFFFIPTYNFGEVDNE